MRAIHHHLEARSDGHLFVNAPACRCVQFLRAKLKAVRLTDNRATLRAILFVQRQVIAPAAQPLLDSGILNAVLSVILVW